MDSLDKIKARQKVQNEKTEKKKAASSTQKPAPSRKSSAGDEPTADKKSPAVRRSAASSSSSPVERKRASGKTADAKAALGAEVADATRKKKRRRRRKKSKYSWIFTTIKIMILIFIAAAIGIGIWVFSVIDFSFGDNLSYMNLNISSKVYYLNDDGEAMQYDQFNASQNRVWVPIDKMPLNMRNAIVAIEDQRFYEHRGVDLKRTTGAALNYLFKGDSTYGGSTITQQLVKNITEDKSRDASRKVREITRAIVLETKLSKEQILELYLNTIYLSQGANGVEAASNIFFSKNVSDLTLSECACIAGITQYPTKYDPITHPEANEEKRLLVLKKMLELEYISEEEYEEAVNDKIVLAVGKVKKNGIQSYFLDHLFEEIQDDLVELGYTKQFASNMIYNGGLKIYSTVNPEIQTIMENYFEDSSNFSSYSGTEQPQAAMIISDPHTGEIKGIVGGRGEKNLNRGLNRATHSKRQPGSSIKPIAVYGPAIDQGVITPSTTVDDSPLKINEWVPMNSNDDFRGYVSVNTAVTWSYNIPAIRVLEALTVEKSYDYMKNRLHMNSLTTADKDLSPLSLGGLTEGVTLLEMNGAYATFANDGEYIEPHSYTKIYDVEGKVILEKKPHKNKAFSPATAFQINNLLRNVVKSGTGAGAQLSNMDTCGKTGTSDKSKDRWFVGYSPYYVGTVWFGYDSPKTVSAGNNPALVVWEGIMSKIHKPLASKYFEAPDGVEERTVCQRTGKSPSSTCPRVTQYADPDKVAQKCEGDHKYIGTKPYKSMESEEEETETGESDEETTGGEENSESGKTDETTTAPPPGENTIVPPAELTTSAATEIH